MTTDFTSAIAVFFTKTYTRILNPSLAELDPDHRPRKPWRRFEPRTTTEPNKPPSRPENMTCP
jgi:hypothetical protein